MDSTSKLSKLSEGSEDRISNLPNSVIGQILSLLPIKNAVATTILSTKWTDIWTSSIDDLDFDDGIFLNLKNSYSDPELQASFTNFVNRVLLLGTLSHVRRFSLKCKGRYKKANTNAWVSAALSHNVQELYIDFHGSSVSKVPAKICVENLKILHLHNVNFRDDCVNRLIASCHVLEDLEIVFCGVGFEQGLKIIAPLLKRLALENISEHGDLYGEGGINIVFDTPRLEYFDYGDDEGLNSFSVKNLNALVKASIHFGPTDRVDYDSSLIELVQGVTNVQSLKISGSAMHALGLHDVPMFRNLTHLMLGRTRYYFWLLLPKVLGNTPMLEQLDFYEGLLSKDTYYDMYPSDDDDDDDDDDDVEVPSCFLSNLSEITVSCFDGRTEDQKWVEYLLENCMVLKKMEIKLTTSDRMEELTEELLKLPRASATCQVVVV